MLNIKKKSIIMTAIAVALLTSYNTSNAAENKKRGFSYTYEEGTVNHSCGAWSGWYSAPTIWVLRNGQRVAQITHPVQGWNPNTSPKDPCLNYGIGRKDQWQIDCSPAGLGTYIYLDTKEEAIEWAKQMCRR